VAEGQITHFKDWEVGNHEDGYLIGLNNIIEIFSAILKDAEKSHDNNLSDSSE
jgi:1D-myo-inositol-triphosphate 3-kinase